MERAALRTSVSAAESLDLLALQGGEPAPEGHSYIASSYIKFLESAGARVVPILHDMTPAEITRR